MSDTLDLVLHAEKKVIQAAQLNGGFATIDGREVSLTPLFYPEKEVDPSAKPLQVGTVSAVVGYIETVLPWDKRPDEGYFLTVGWEKGGIVVRLQSGLSDYRQRARESLIEATCRTTVWDVFDRYFPQEQFLATLRKHFVRDEALENLLQTISRLEHKAVRTVEDDGLQQEAVMRKAVGGPDWDKIPREVKLRPMVIFPDMEQPEVEFGLRVTGSDDAAPQLKLIELCGTWATEALAAVGGALRAQVPEETPVFW